MDLTIPNLSLVVMIGSSGSGKSTFARSHFAPTEILSSDFCRGLVSNDENSQDATNDAFDVLHYIAGKRLTRGLLTVIDATNVQPESRKPLVALAREHDVLPVAIVLNLPERECLDRNKQRPDRQFGPHVIRNQISQLRRSMRGLRWEGFRHIYALTSLDEVSAAQIKREPLWNDRRAEHGPFDIIGDVHGCYDELVALLEKLGYAIENSGIVTSPHGRKAVFVGDLVDRGPKVPQVLKLVMNMVGAGLALCVPGNHDIKLMRKLRGKDVQITHGLAETLLQLEAETEEFRVSVAEFIDRLVSHYVFDAGKLVVAHAGMKEQYQGRGSGRVREFALYGETTGETDEFGLPVRHNWAAEYRGAGHVVYGHTPVPHAEWLNRTMNIDTGCVFGGALTALRYPENEIVSIQAFRTYSEPAKPFLPAGLEAPALTSQQANDDVLDLEDVIGKRIVNTRLMSNVTVREENAIAALEVMSRFATNPKWLIYLPPTMSPTETTQTPGLLEHPSEAFAYYRSNGVGKVICEEKHMGSRAVVVVCRDVDTSTRRFGIEGDGAGVIYTRTGRRFFEDRAVEAALLEHVRIACTTAGCWEEFATDWFCFDCELMPWSAKAQELLKNQYAAVGSAARAGLTAALELLEQTAPQFEARQDLSITDMLAHYRHRRQLAIQYTSAYRGYCWPVQSVEDLKLAPFHLLASEGKVHVDKDHLWHMQALARLSEFREGNPSPIISTRYKTIDVTDAQSEADGVEWWSELTRGGGEGMVVKPLDFVVRGNRGLVQPAVKCRGPEYLRIIYGPEYDAPENISRLRSRGVGTKRALAIREFALGIEALERFVRHEPLRRVHECVFGVLAMESEPVDARL
ncbi:MAG: polynucleotide kinase-phosphatase [Planctomycetota bacterium]|nr:polynucleotide kinase-phosphatase [Planctomycetota bacterium]